MGRAYATIGVPKLAALLGCSEAEATQGGRPLACLGSVHVFELGHACCNGKCNVCIPTFLPVSCSLVTCALSCLSPALLPTAHACMSHAAAAASGQGWAVGQDGLVEVKPPAVGAATSSAAAEQALQRLASYVVHLEI